MKTKLFWLMAILSVISISCDKTSLGGDGPGNGGNDGPLPELSPLEEVDNVCDKMDDLKFMSYCYENFDVNKDGKVSMSEASAVEAIVYHKASSFAGLEYFNNLKNFESHSVETVDFRYNSMLETIDCSESKVTKVDLRYNKNLLTFSFDGCSLLTSIGGIPDSVTEIGSRAFYGCSSLTTIDIPDSVTEIGSLAFSDCSSLTDIDIPDGVTEINYNIFLDCNSLRKVNAKNCDALSRIYNGAFYNCPIEEFLLGAVNVPEFVVAEVQNPRKPFSYENHILKVPAESVEAYKNSEWAEYFNNAFSHVIYDELIKTKEALE